MRRIILQPCENSNNLGIRFASFVRIQVILENVLQARGTFVRFCLKRFIVGTVPSVLVSFNVYNISIYNAKRKRLDLSMSRLHNLEVRAPRGNLVKSIVIEPRKSSLDQNYERAEEVKCVREKYKITHIGLYCGQ